MIIKRMGGRTFRRKDVNITGNLLVVVISLGIAIINTVSAQNPLKPNIVLLLSDDHGAADMGCAGNPDVRTPVMDQLATEGMMFDRAFAPASVCTPSRSAIYTGLYPHRNGCHQNHGNIDTGIKTLPEYLLAQGYRIALAGKVHVAPEPSFPFEYIERHEIPDFLASAKKEPFCLIIAYNSPHEPYFNKKNGISYRNIKAKEWLPDTRETRMLTAGYYDNIENLDQEVGTSLYWLEKAGIADETMVIYTSDHGPGLPFGKWTLYENALHVPLIIKWNGIIQPGTRSDALVSLVDLLPTLTEMAGRQTPDDLDGKSLLPLIIGESNTHHEYTYAAYTNKGVQDANTFPIRSIRNGQYKLIVNFNHEEPFTIRMTERPDDRAVVCGYRVLESWEMAIKKDSFAADRYQQFRYRQRLELYDLKNDPFELENLAGQVNHRTIQQTLIKELKKWLYEQGDMVYEEI
jgi:N-sulfoglucosamine sulfohydrolase